MNKKAFFIIMLTLGIIIFMYLISINNTIQSEISAIQYEDKIDNLRVKKAYNERGIYILNDQYYVNSSTFIVGTNTIKIEDDAIWRPKGSEHKPRISDIEAPFIISKNKNSDTIFIQKDGSTISLLLSK
ncbi:hypothetical protein D0817_03095 [Flavobacterium cupreum]|uniref:Uncharacterized protein n=1 Tax=Flavobacterium cupreum TaxID=2133766 RepID=A0A434ABG4_9FLAO|nr:hypothetical protein [Flavobacterium cupreum]RUT71686.1 hypothetical protein D0817_03095 [Flavobacterium cupreum]